jgi:DNA-binding NarL/FixJ family response regulator
MKIILSAREADLRLASQLLLTEEPNVDIVGTASTVSGLCALLNTYQVDIVILDKELSDKPTDELVGKIKNSKSHPKIILLSSTYIHPQTISEIEVDAFVNKTEPPDQLLAAFRRLAAESIPESNHQEKENIES